MAGGETVELSHDYSTPPGDTVLGIRPEFVRLSKDEGLPVQINRVQDAGRRKFVNATCGETEINIVLDPGTEIEADMTRIAFDPAQVSIFSDDHRIEGSAL